jgi:hypothetical protein
MLNVSCRKTQTAVEYCWRFRKANPDFHVFWIHAGSIVRFDADYRRLAKKLGLECHASSFNNTDMRDGVKDWLNDNENLLMVIDNADRYDDFFAPPEDDTDDTIQAALPWSHASTAMVIYTSRHDRVGTRLTDHDCLRLDVLSDADGITMFRSRTSDLSSDEKVMRLLVALDHLPLSIAHAIAYLKFTNITIDAYLSRLEESEEGLLDMLDQDVDIGRRDLKAPRSVVKAWQVSFELICKRNKSAANLFCLMACSDRNDIPRDLIFFACDRSLRELSTRHIGLSIDVELPESQGDRWTAVGEILSLGLIAPRLKGMGFSMHRHVQAIVVRRLRDEGQLLAFAELLMQAILSMTESLDHGKDLVLWDLLSPTLDRGFSLLQECRTCSSVDQSNVHQRFREILVSRITVFISYAQARTHKNICDVNEALQKIAVDEELMLHDAEASQAEKRIA